jgi:hypothetical protein
VGYPQLMSVANASTTTTATATATTTTTNSIAASCTDANPENGDSSSQEMAPNAPNINNSATANSTPLDDAENEDGVTLVPTNKLAKPTTDEPHHAARSDTCSDARTTRCQDWWGCVVRQGRALGTALRQTVSSPGFVSLAAGVVTGMIPPLQQSLFQPGGVLRFLGDALQTMGQASSAISIMVVAASLVPQALPPVASSSLEPVEESMSTMDVQANNAPAVEHRIPTRDREDHNPIMSDPNFGTFQRQRRRRLSMQQVRRSMRRNSARLWESVRLEPEAAVASDSLSSSRKDRYRVLLWFALSSLVVTPAIVVTLIVVLDCYFGALLASVPPLAKLVVMINSGLPGALIVVVLLKSNAAFAETAASVAQVYLPTYLLSVVTIAAWTTIGLWITVPDEDGYTMCQR